MSEFTSLLTRKFIKSLIMPSTYSKTEFKMAIDLKEVLIFKKLYKKIKEDKTEFKDETHKAVYKIISSLVSKVINILNEEFPKIKKLKNLFQLFAKLGNLTEEGVYITLANINDQELKLAKIPKFVGHCDLNNIFSGNIPKDYYKYSKEMEDIKSLSFIQAYKINKKVRIQKRI
jgi:hypothetical protein